MQASQTLPLITEELAATHISNAQSTSTTTPHVTTPVMPPNPIRREESQGSATRMLQANTTVVNDTADLGESAPPDTDTNDKAEKKTKSESRVSATQLLAGAAAAATSSVIGGQLGVAGTVVGAGVASIITGLAVTLYTSSLDKGKEKIKEVGTKLAPAVKAKSLDAKTQRSAAAEAFQASGPSQVTGTFGSPHDEAAADTSLDATSSADTSSDAIEGSSDEPKSWWQKLRRKRVLYPVAIGVATFGIGLGAVVMAESFTDADISPGTSQISRSVSGKSGTGDESGSSQDGGGTSESGSSGADSQPGQNPNQGSGNEGSTTSEGQSTSANEGSSTASSTADQTGTDQGTDASSSAATGDDTAGAGSDSSGSSSSGADASGGGATSSGGSSGSGSQGSAGSSDSGSSGSGSAGGSSAATAEG
ncbi:hypothetical protein [Brevibacterium antiquum]|uniref:hypothetical protein n=1 Tax=Brevibacterium antiquum TaxID=234835 RepID=UPI0011AF6B50|nr:hypothetical protein [Brevibacterium antiquum]